MKKPPIGMVWQGQVSNLPEKDMQQLIDRCGRISNPPLRTPRRREKRSLCAFFSARKRQGHTPIFKRTIKPFLAILITGVLSSLALGQAPPNLDRRQAESELQKVKEQLQRKTDSLAVLTKREEQAQAKSRALREEMELLEEVRQRLQEKYRLLDREYSTSDRQVRELEERYAYRQEVLARMLGSLARSKSLSTQSDIPTTSSGLERRRFFARLVAQAQAGVLMANADSLEVWQGRRAGLAQSRTKVEAAATGKEKEKQRRESLAAKSEREAFAYRQQREQQLDDLEQVQREALLLAELIDRLTALEHAQGAVDYDFPGWKGRLHWPLAGTVKSTVGTRIDPRYGTQTSETGIFIAGPPGRQVVNAADGEVVYVGRQRGLGNLVIVGHGSGYFSIFAHLGETSVLEGQVVRAGDPVGTAGVNHPRYGAGVLFELRHEKEVLDPLEWLK